MRICYPELPWFRSIGRSVSGARRGSRRRATDRVAALEAEVAQLRRELEDLKQQFSGFQKQFE